MGKFKGLKIDKINNKHFELLYTLQKNYLIAIIAILFISLSYDKNHVFSQSETLTFEDNSLGVKFQYPEEWNVEGSNLYTKSITECTTLPCIRLPEISIDVSTIGSGVPSLENFTKEQNETKSVSNDYRLIEINQTTVGDKDAFQHIYLSKLTSIGGPEEDILKYDVYIKEGSKLYKLAFTSTFDELTKYLDSYKNILNNFQITSQ